MKKPLTHKRLREAKKLFPKPQHNTHCFTYDDYLALPKGVREAIHQENQ